MREAKNLMRLIAVISVLLMAEPFIKVLVLKTQTGLDWSLIWSNIRENSQSFSRFFSFWLLSPLTGIFLLTYSRLAYGLYFGLTLYKLYALFSFEAFSWPYMTKTPHFSAYLFEGVNFILMLYLFYPLLQRFFLSRFLRNVWDARGRIDCYLKSMIILEGHQRFVEATIHNISSGGVNISFLESQLELSGEEDLRGRSGKIMFFDHEGSPLSFDFDTKAHREKEGRITLGLEFVGLSPKEKIFLRSLLKDQFAVPLQKNDEELSALK